MPKGYVIFTEDIRDQDAMGAYTNAAMPTMAGQGVSVLAVDPAPQVLEGEWHGNQTVVLEFDTVEAAGGLVRLGGVREGEAVAPGHGRDQRSHRRRLRRAAPPGLTEVLETHPTARKGLR